MQEVSLDHYIQLLEEELERQENVLSLCKGQGVAVRTHDVSNLEAKTSALEILAKDSARMEILRKQLSMAIWAQYGLGELEPNKEPNMSMLIQIVPEPWHSRLTHLQLHLQTVLNETADVIKENARLLRYGLSIINQATHSVEQVFGDQPNHYTPNGLERNRNFYHAALIDQRG